MASRFNINLDYPSARWTKGHPDLSHPLFHSKDCLALPEEMLGQLSSRQLAAYSLSEAVNFLRLNIAGERYGMGTMRSTPESFFQEHQLLHYRETMLEEEASHTEAFVHVLEALGEGAETQVSLLGREKELRSSMELTEFLAHLFVFEFVTTEASKVMMRDPEVEEVFRSVHRFHWEDERHHIEVTFQLLRSLGAELSPGERAVLLKRAGDWALLLKRALLYGASHYFSGSGQKDLLRAAFDGFPEHPLWSRFFRQAEARLAAAFQPEEA